jgi:sulfite reductase (NADPH) flavoprotein alpha-component
MSLSLIPETAPFNAEQRAWLNGFLAGWVGLQDVTSPVIPSQPALTGMGTAAAPAEAPPAEEFPWHDPALGIDDRMKLAEGKPKPLRLMAAMAQLDCGTCGYLCKTYSEAIANGTEKSLTLCSPGGSETSKMLKKLVKEASTETNGSANGNGAAHANGKSSTNEVAASDGKSHEAGWSRKNPYTARLLRSVILNRPGSDKTTHHIEIDLSTEGPTYEVGDSLGIFPTNCDEHVGEIIQTLGAEGNEPVETQGGVSSTLREALDRFCCLSEVNEDLIVLLSETAIDPAEADQLRALIDDDAPIAGFHVFDLLRKFPSARPTPALFVLALADLKPRLYSISSSPKRHAGQVHLTVRKVVYEYNSRGRKGVASTMLADRVNIGGPLRVFIQKSHGFTIPSDPNVPAIMVGPGTGIAPFRAFLHERDVIGAKGKNWLFFGDQRGQFDYLYEEELAEMKARGVLTRLDTAFSRDQDRKVYVQDRIVENGEELYAWLQEGAHFFVCGDAKRMAADVDRALRQVVKAHGAMTDEAATAYVAKLSTDGRYRRDVY